jgi:hypothetical protein
MGMIKPGTKYIPCQHPHYRLRGVHPDWEMHPSWIAGIEALDAYNHWVAEVVMPIAFQWIEEHKAEVYAKVPRRLQDDTGVVVAAAFDLVKKLSAYKNGMAEFEKYQAALAEGTWQPSSINPVWTKIVKKVRGETRSTFAAQKSFLKDTIR